MGMALVRPGYGITIPRVCHGYAVGIPRVCRKCAMGVPRICYVRGAIMLGSAEGPPKVRHEFAMALHAFVCHVCPMGVPKMCYARAMCVQFVRHGSATGLP